MSDTFFSMCGVAQYAEEKHQGRADRAPTSGNDVTALQNERVVYVTDDNYRNPLRDGRSEMVATLWAEEAGIYQSFTKLPD